MRAIIQRVSRAEVRVGDEVVGRIGAGMLVLLGIFKTDEKVHADRLAARTARQRIFDDGTGRMNRSLIETSGEALVVSQFTLAATTERGLRPSFESAAAPEVAEGLYAHYCTALAAHGVRVATGRFRALMAVEMVGDGPVTLILDEPRAAKTGEGGA